MAFALPLCPPSRIEEALALMTAEVVDMTEEAKIFAEEFIAYIRNTYMSGVFGNLVDGFEWNAYDRVEEGFLTNNPSEGANNRLFKRAKNPHPGVYKFCELLKSELENVKNKCEQFEQGLLLPPPRSTRASKVAQNRIQLKEMLERGQQSLRKYLRTLGRMNHVQRSKRLGGVATLEQHLSSEVIAKDTSSLTMFDSILPGALESVSADEPPPTTRGRGARGGRMRRAGGARGRGAAPLFR